MPFAILSLAIILIAFGIAAFIIVRKFPKLAALDVEEMPEEKENKKKKEILDRRAKEKVSAFVKRVKERGSKLPLKELGSKIAHHTKRGASFIEFKYTKLLDEKHKKKAKKMDEGELSETIGTKLRAAERFVEEERCEDAEQAYIDVIRMDNKHAGAYRGLGKTYMKNLQHEEAEETFKFLLKLTPDDDTIYVKLGQNADAAGARTKAIEYYEKGIEANPDVARRHFELADLYREDGQEKEALREYQKALKLESENPRYLDGVLDISIQLGKIAVSHKRIIG